VKRRTTLSQAFEFLTSLRLLFLPQLDRHLPSEGNAKRPTEIAFEMVAFPRNQPKASLESLFLHEVPTPE
jgi:hypothetical protein